MAIETKQLHALSKIYKEQVAEDMQKGYVVTAADKKGNTKAWQGYKSGAKKKDGTALYTAADHLKNEEVVYEKVATGPRLGEPREKGATHMNAGEQGKISKRTKAWMDKKGQPGSPGGDAMKAREAEHKARRGVKKAKKDYDGDGKIESGKAEYFGSKDKAIKKAMGKKEVKEADTYAAQLARFEAGRQKRMKASGTYERPKWIPKDQDHSDDYGSSKGQKTTKENYQAMRNPEKEEKKDKRSAREKRMADPKKGINSPAFKEFMRQQGM